MKNLAVLFVILAFSTFSTAQDICAKVAELEKINTRKILLTYDDPMGEAICEKLNSMRDLTILLDDVSYQYTLFYCDPATHHVVYIPLPDQEPVIKSYDVLKLAYPSGEIATYGKFTSSRLYSGNLLNCEMLPPDGAAIPTLSQWAILILSLLLGICGISLLKYRMVLS